MSDLDIAAVQRALRQFAKVRDWEQFHTPKNLAMALAGEVGELSEIFQWKTAEESWRVMEEARTAQAARDEIADVVIYAFRLADLLSIDLGEAVWAKIRQNEAKYPAARVRGSAVKYTDIV
jgi:dCTP diphosphatase